MTDSRRLAWAAALAMLAATPCAYASPPGAARPAVARAWLTSGDGRARLREVAMAAPSRAPPDHAATVVLDPATRYQAMLGFGAALTDASVDVLTQRLAAAQQDSLLRELFHTGSGERPSLGLSLLRVPIGATDFSSRAYTLDDVPSGQADPELVHFDIDPLQVGTIPLLKRVVAMNPAIRLVASPWSAPPWMKDSGRFAGGHLEPKWYGAYARYLARFIETYRHNGLRLWAITVQNEPRLEPLNYPGMGMRAAERAAFLSGHLGPLLASLPDPPLVLEWDHNWNHPEEPRTLLEDPEVSRYVGGVAWHCYEGSAADEAQVQAAFPDVPMYITECSGGGWDGSWDRALANLVDQVLIAGIRAGARGVALWNLALDEVHGPHFGGCANCRGVLAVAADGSITRNVEYYALGQFSRFIQRGATRIGARSSNSELDCVAFENPDRTYVLVAFNRAASAVAFELATAVGSAAADSRAGRITLPPASVVTVVLGRARRPPG